MGWGINGLVSLLVPRRCVRIAFGHFAPHWPDAFRWRPGLLLRIR